MRSLIRTLALGTALVSSGCFIAVEDDDHFEPVRPARGDLGLAWTFDGGFIDCGPVVEVEVSLVDPEGFIYDDSRYSCELAGLVYEEVDEGWWSLDMIGLDRFGRVIYRGGGDLFVNGNAFNEYDIDLQVW